LRYLEWRWDPDPADTWYLLDFAFLLRESDGSVRAEKDRHRCGLFARAEWLRWLAEAGFQPEAIGFELSVLEGCTGELFVGVKRPAAF
jgi:hypothetical protein